MCVPPPAPDTPPQTPRLCPVPAAENGPERGGSPQPGARGGGETRHTDTDTDTPRPSRGRARSGPQRLRGRRREKGGGGWGVPGAMKGAAAVPAPEPLPRRAAPHRRPPRSRCPHHGKWGGGVRAAAPTPPPGRGFRFPGRGGSAGGVADPWALSPGGCPAPGGGGGRRAQPGPVPGVPPGAQRLRPGGAGGCPGPPWGQQPPSPLPGAIVPPSRGPAGSPGRGDKRELCGGRRGGNGPGARAEWGIVRPGSPAPAEAGL